MDRVSPQVRSKIMAAVRSGGGSAERKMATILQINKFPDFRAQWSVAGKPDFAWPDQKVALFIDGCFWHGCPRCMRRLQSKSNVEFWQAKVITNRRRDVRVSRQLRREGWRVLRVWECAVGERRTLLRIGRAVCASAN